VISPQLAKYSRQVVKKHNLTFSVLGDTGNRVAAAFGLTFSLPEALQKLYSSFGIDLPRFNGDDSWTLPLPARFVLDASGTVTDAEAHPDYTQRPDPEGIVDLL
jgi:peroxiredoxin